MRTWRTGVAPVPARLAKAALAACVAAGVAGVGLEVAGVRSAVRAVLVLLFLAVAPTAAVAGLLRSLDPFARLVIACAADLTLLALTAIVMLAAGAWSPTGGLLAVAGITAACLAAQLPPVRRWITRAGGVPGREPGATPGRERGATPGRERDVVPGREPGRGER